MYHIAFSSPYHLSWTLERDIGKIKLFVVTAENSKAVGRDVKSHNLQ